MTALHDRFAQSQAMLFGKMFDAQSGGGGNAGGMDGFMKGIEFAQEMVQGQAEAAAEKDESGSDLKELLEGVKVFAGIMLGITFHMLNGLFSNLGIINSWPPYFSAITPSALFLLAAAGMLWWIERR